MTDRFRLSRAGVLNVWQYDDQVFEFADGRLLLRGANGAGKSKTLEMLLPFVLDGDKQRMTASARHHTSLLWLMLDGYGKQNRAGYLWVEFARPRPRSVTCGVGIRASQSARTATSWYFTVPGRVGEELMLEDDAGPARPGTAAGPRWRPRAGTSSTRRAAYKQHVGRLLFGLAPTQYDELLRLLYWLRQPQVGEDIEPARLAEQLVQALPQLDDDAVRAAGDTFDELAAFGEQLDRQRRSAEGVAALATTYGHYAREVLRGRGTEAVEQHRERSRRARDAERCAADVAGLATERAAAEAEQGTVATQRRECEARLVELRGDPAWKDARELRARQEMARERAAAAEAARRAADGARRRAEASGERVRRDAGGLETTVSAHVVRVGELATELAGAGARVALAVPAALHDVHLLAVDAAQAAAEGLAAPGRCHPRRPPGPRRAARCRRGRRHRPHGARRRRRDPGARRAGRRRRRAAGRGGARPPGGRASRGQPPPATSTRRRSGRGGTDPQAVPFDPPDELTAETVGAVATLARAAASGPLDARRAEEAAAGAERRAAEREHTETVRRRDGGRRRARSGPAGAAVAAGRARSRGRRAAVAARRLRGRTGRATTGRRRGRAGGVGAARRVGPRRRRSARRRRVRRRPAGRPADAGRLAAGRRPAARPAGRWARRRRGDPERARARRPGGPRRGGATRWAVTSRPSSAPMAPGASDLSRAAPRSRSPSTSAPPPEPPNAHGAWPSWTPGSPRSPRPGTPRGTPRPRRGRRVRRSRRGSPASPRRARC